MGARREEDTLFAWRDEQFRRRRTFEMEAERRNLIDQIKRLKPRSHRRIDLEARLKMLTADVLELETRR
ncbi:MAG: hypothetical protein CME90_11140 [Hoeflea sp.]|nr:hypothetical protein [Hoeflea sp.]|tara:strand:+ start:9232 stop:9438 length:207 start_codon:yes stop_codon:yes gene_type:complete